jgi:hypothetical protein
MEESELVWGRPPSAVPVWVVWDRVSDPVAEQRSALFIKSAAPMISIRGNPC